MIIEYVKNYEKDIGNIQSGKEGEELKKRVEE
jgi:hypothetical protein